MKFSILQMTLIIAAQCSAFVTQPTYSGHSALVLNAVELEPEPEGGEELQAVSRMKNMGEASEFKAKDGTAYNFWLTAQAGAALIKTINTRVLKHASKNAEFPGWRKVSRECYLYYC
jgi:hypothetical protein